MAIVALDVNSISHFVNLGLKFQNLRVSSLVSAQALSTNSQSLFSSVKSDLTSLRTMLTDLTLESNLLLKAVEVADEDILAATVGTGAVNTNYKVQVNTLSDAHTIASSALTNTATTMLTAEGAGTYSFRLTINSVSTDYSVTIGASDDDKTVLESIREAVNATATDVVASIINETSGTSSLIFQSKQAGVTERITLTDLTGTVLQSAGVIDATDTIQRSLAAGNDASILINDTITITRPDNEIEDAIPGLTVTLRSTGTTNLTISNDVDGTANKIKDFVDKFNSAISKLRSIINEKPDPRNPFAGALHLNSTLARSMSILRTEAGVIPTSGVFGLFDVGITPFNVLDDKAKTGELKIDMTKLKDVIATDSAKVLALFADAADGLSVRLGNKIDELTDTTEGSLTVRIDAEESRQGVLKRRLDAAKRNLENRRTALTNKFNNLLLRQSQLRNTLNSINQIRSFTGGLGGSNSGRIF